MLKNEQTNKKQNNNSSNNKKPHIRVKFGNVTSQCCTQDLVGNIISAFKRKFDLNTKGVVHLNIPYYAINALTMQSLT